MRTRFILLFVAVTTMTVAQVTTTPATLHKEDLSGTITITFDPNAGTAGMKNATACYCHTGLITSESLNDDDWKNVIGSWRDAAQPKLTATPDGKWQLTINNVYTFYGVPATTEIIKLAFVFHDGPGGSKEGKATGNKNIYVAIEGVGTEVGIWRGFNPDPVTVASRPSGVVNGIYYDENDPTKVTLCTYAASKVAPANHVFVLGDMTDWKLNNTYQMKRDGNYFWTTLTGLTPGKEYRFQYAVERADGVKKQICDLYSEKVIHPDDKHEPRQHDPMLIDYPTTGADGGFVTVIQTNKPKFNWSSATLNFKRPNKNNLVIYELWVYDYTEERSYTGLMKRLDYIKNLGVNAVELMPICEFDGNYNWGYSPCLYFAPDKAYGTADQLKMFIDECHMRGIAVILDVVFNHATGNNPMNKLYPYGSDLAQNPWFNVTAPHSDNVYEDWNHGFAPAHDMFVRALKYWLTEYKIDGYRLDLSHGLCSDQPGTSVGNLTDYYQKGVKSVSSDAYMILEHWGSNMGSERPQLISYGMMCWNNTTNAYCQTAMGWLKDGDSYMEANRDGYISYAESHDEERMQYKVKTYGNGDLQSNESARLNRVAANVVMNVLLNGSHMLWQYEEIGYDFSINSDIDHPDGTNSGYRCNKKPRPESLGYFTDSNRTAQYVKCAQAIQLRTRLLPNVFAGNPTASNLGSGVALRTVQWGSDVLVAANLSVLDNQTLTVPSGTWYNYYKGGKASGTITLAPGDIVILTGSQLTLPTIPSTVFDFNTDVENITVTEKQPLTPPYDAEIYSVSGQPISYKSNVYDVNTDELPKGMYIVVTTNTQGRYAYKIVR